MYSAVKKPAEFLAELKRIAKNEGLLRIDEAIRR
jgi:hypothetical protein